MKYIITIAISILFTIFATMYFDAPETVIEVRRDTVTVVRVDTIKHANVVYRDRWRIRTDTITYIDKGDTIYVPIPIDKYVFTDDTTYRAELSGYNVTMDKMDVYNRFTDRVITVDREIVGRRKRFGLGVQVGYGFGKNGMQPYVGLGISYNLLNF